MPERPYVPPRPALRQPQRQPSHIASPPAAVLIDGSALYMAARSLYEGRQLDYHGVIQVLVDQIKGLERPGPGSSTSWVMWTSAAPQNPGQTRFLDFAENELQWEVRRVAPAESFTVEPSLVMDASQTTRSRLIRFDASIAFAMGRLAEKRRIVVVSDSFALAQPLSLVARVPGVAERTPPKLAFFSQAIDSRWQGVIRKSEGLFIGLEDFEAELFGSARIEHQAKEVRADQEVF
jgi:hypothetical protein